MPPIISREIGSLLKEVGAIDGLVNTFGSPLHILFPDQARANARRWIACLESVYPLVKIRYAVKACRSKALTS